MKYLGTTFFSSAKSNTTNTVLGQAEDGTLWQINIFKDGSYTTTGGCNCCSHPKLVKELKEQGICFGDTDSGELTPPPPEEWQDLRKEHDENPKLYTFEG